MLGKEYGMMFALSLPLPLAMDEGDSCSDGSSTTGTVRTIQE